MLSTRRYRPWSSTEFIKGLTDSRQKVIERIRRREVAELENEEEPDAFWAERLDPRDVILQQESSGDNMPELDPDILEVSGMCEAVDELLLGFQLVPTRYLEGGVLERQLSLRYLIRRDYAGDWDLEGLAA